MQPINQSSNQPSIQSQSETIYPNCYQVSSGLLPWSSITETWMKTIQQSTAVTHSIWFVVALTPCLNPRPKAFSRIPSCFFLKTPGTLLLLDLSTSSWSAVNSGKPLNHLLKKENPLGWFSRSLLWWLLVKNGNSDFCPSRWHFLMIPSSEYLFLTPRRMLSQTMRPLFRYDTSSVIKSRIG